MIDNDISITLYHLVFIENDIDNDRVVVGRQNYFFSSSRAKKPVLFLRSFSRENKQSRMSIIFSFGPELACSAATPSQLTNAIVIISYYNSLPLVNTSMQRHDPHPISSASYHNYLDYHNHSQRFSLLRTVSACQNQSQQQHVVYL